MTSIHRVEISWEDLLAAFTNGETNLVYFLDRFTGEIFFIPAAGEDNDVRQQLDQHQDRFLEIPPFDYRIERHILSGFVASVTDAGLKKLLMSSMSGSKPFGKIEDILSFYPREEERLMLFKDNFLSSRLKSWMEDNNLFTADTIAHGATHP
jgi:hypothetical protein